MVKLLEDLSVAELRQRFLTCEDPSEQVRWEALWLCSLPLGRTGARPPMTRVADAVGMPLSGLLELVEAYNDRGAEAVPTKLRYESPGRPPILNAEEIERLADAIRDNPELDNARGVGEWVEANLGKKGHRSTWYAWLRAARAELPPTE